MLGGENGFLQDSKGNFSVMRLMFTILILDAVLKGWYTLLFIGPAEAVAVFSAVTAVAVTLKTIQNQQEKETLKK